jgi:hypothetical protein
MADDQSNKSEQSPEDEALTKRVDAMMASNEKDATPAVAINVDQPKKEKPPTAPPLEGIYKPKLPAKPPIVIKLAEEKPPVAEVAEPDPGPDSPPEEPPESVPLDDQKTDEAVDDIAAKEGDTVLALEDAKVARQVKAAGGKPSWKTRLKSLFKNKWTWVAVAVLIIIIFALPVTRYKILGLLIKKPITITVLDSRTATPVSSAEVQLGGDSAKTDAGGRVKIDASLGKHSLRISKQYYQILSVTYFVGFKAPGQPVSEKLTATGRLVPITVLNNITGKPLSGADVKLKGTTAKTNSKGQADVALPTTASSYGANLTLTGYNSADITVTVTDQVVKANTFQLTPAGHVYFLSNASGNIDVVKTNLDGTGRKTIFAGTGHEDPNTTSLLASRDWRYLVLKSKHDGGQPALYLIDTSNDKVTEFDNSGADLTLVGWYGHDFIYDLNKSSEPNWQAGREQLKSYDADNLQLNQLDQTQAEGSADSYAYQTFSNFYIVNGAAVYSTQWTTFNSDGSAYNTTGKSDTIRAVEPNGQNKKDYETFSSVDTTGYIQGQLYAPQAVYFAVYDNGNGSTTYYDYEDQAVKTASIDNGTFVSAYPTYLISPSGSQTFWTELRDGQNALFTGDSNASSKKQIASLSDYSPYGWYSNNYVLVSKNSSQLYIMPSSGLTSGQLPLKVTDYFKPTQTYPGYGYGYGGL